MIQAVEEGPGSGLGGKKPGSGLLGQGLECLQPGTHDGLGLGVDRPNARAGYDVVELVKEQGLHQGIEPSPRVVGLGKSRPQGLDHPEGLLEPPIVLLGLGLGGEGAPVVL